MTFLYLCRTDGDQYRMVKMTSLSEVESSYLCSETRCECPAGVRPTCRHREMIPKFIHRGAINTGWAFDYDRGGWVQTEYGSTDDAPIPELPATVIYENKTTRTEADLQNKRDTKPKALFIRRRI